MKQDYKIYKAENIENGFVYVGATTKSLEERIVDHLQKASKGTGSYFQEAIGTYGPEAFTWEQIDTAYNENELAQKEKNYILTYNSVEEGYNSDSGGGIKKTVYQYSKEDGSLVAEYNSLENAANTVSANKKSISNVCLGQNKTCKGFYWSYSDSFTLPLDLRKRKVLQCDLEGNVIKEYESVSEASRLVDISKTCISRVCRGEREQSGGFLWKYKFNV